MAERWRAVLAVLFLVNAVVWSCLFLGVMALDIQSRDLFYTSMAASSRRCREAGLTVAPLRRGMTPAEALLLATRNAADALGKLHRFGTLEKGKLADMIVVDGYPLGNIRVLQDLNAVELVIKEGAVEGDRRGA